MARRYKTLEEVQERLRKMQLRRGTRVGYAAGEALKECAYGIMAESVREVPVDTGRLRQSARVGKVRYAGMDLAIDLGYGTDYALAVHERTDVGHKVGKAKYLSDPINRWRPKITEKVGKAVEIALKREKA